MKKNGNKEVKNIMSCIDFLAEKLIEIIKKLGKYISNKNTHDTIYIFAKILVSILFVYISSIIFDFVDIIGRNIVFLVGVSFRNFLSSLLHITVRITYYIFCFIVLLTVFRSILKDKELNFIEDNRRKDTILKKKVLNPIIELIKAILNILTIPASLVIIFCMIALGMNLSFLTHGYMLIGTIFVFLGLGIMCLSAILAIKHVIRGDK